MDEFPGASPQWTVEYDTDGDFARFVARLGDYERAVLVAAIEKVLSRYGLDICQSEWGRPLKGGLYEFRIRRSLRTILNEYGSEASPSVRVLPDRPVLLRVFCTFYGSRVVLLLGGYDKKKDPSERRQAREIKRARRALHEWSSTRSRGAQRRHE